MAKRNQEAEDGAAVRERWWRTYDAAASGMLASPVRMPLTAVHDRAARFADIAHGPVVETFTPPTPKAEAEVT